MLSTSLGAGLHRLGHRAARHVGVADLTLRPARVDSRTSASLWSACGSSPSPVACSATASASSVTTARSVSLADLRVTVVRAARAHHPVRAALLPPRRPARPSRRGRRCPAGRRAPRPAGVVHRRGRGLATTVALWIMLPAAAVAVAVALLLAAPWSRGSRESRPRNEARRAPARGELTASVVDLLEGAPDLVAFGAIDAQVQRVVEHDRELTRVAAPRRHTAGVGAGLVVLCAGMAMWARSRSASARCTTDVSTACCLAVVALDPPRRVRAGLTVARRRAGARGRTQLCGPALVVMDAASLGDRALGPVQAVGPGPHGTACASAACQRAAHARWSAGARRRRSRPQSGRRVALVGRVAQGSPRSPRRWFASSTTSRVRCELDGVELRDLGGEPGPQRSSASSSKTRTSSTRRCARTCASPSRPPPTPSSLQPSRGRRLSDWVDDAPARPRHAGRRARLFAVGRPAPAPRSRPRAAR